MESPKRKNQESLEAEEVAIKRSRVEDDDIEMAEEIAFPSLHAPADSHINHAAAIAYWSSTPATDDGVLGGFPQVSRVDLQGSANFLAKLRRQSKVWASSGGKKFHRAADCGAGIGRITRGFLCNVAEVVDVIEPVKSFTDQIKDEPYVGDVYNLGLEQWYPDGAQRYELIWNQWCVGQLTDLQLVDYLKRIQSVLVEGGFIVVKENLSTSPKGEDIFDDTDSSVTRTDDNFRRIFQQAGLRVVSTELQRGMPKELYPVRAYALQPR